MIKVLVTRAKHQADEFMNLLKHNGFDPVLLPLIDIVPPSSWDACDKAIGALYMYDGIIFTSANGVVFFFKRLQELNIETKEVANKIICVVGEKTKAVCEQYGLSVTHMPDKFTSNDLFHALKQYQLRDRAFLHPRGNLGKEQLSGNLKTFGAKVDPVIVYNTIPPEQRDVEATKTEILNGEIDAITFTSPSTIKNFTALFTHSEMTTIVTQQKVFVIGPVTKKTAIEHGFKQIYTAPESTIESLIKTLNTSFN